MHLFTKYFLSLKYIACTLFLFIFCNSAQAQINKDTIEVRATIVNGDTMIIIGLPTFTVEGNKIFDDQKAKKAYYDSLVLHRDVLRAYDYAKQAAALIKNIDKQLADAKSSKQEKAIISANETKIKAAFEDEIKNLTPQQGDFFVKLIYRETGKTCYDILKDYKGGLSAFTYQNSAKLQGINLKSTYSPKGADKKIEEIILAGK